jgi:hypothetical protein
VNGMAPMTLEQAVAHQRLMHSLPVRTVMSDEELDDPENWCEKGRPLTPSERAYVRSKE